MTPAQATDYLQGVGIGIVLALILILVVTITGKVKK